MNKNLTEIAYILDRSGSMHSLVEPAITGFNNFIADQIDTSGQANFSLILFDDEYQIHADRKPLEEVSKLDTSTYVPRGSTALLDAIGTTIDNIGKALADPPEQDRPATVIIAIYTDGYENASTQYTAQRINEMIRHQTDTYNWQFLFLAANQDAIQTAASYGIASHNATCVDFTEKDMGAGYSSVSRKVKAHRTTANGTATEAQKKDLKIQFSKIFEEEKSQSD